MTIYDCILLSIVLIIIVPILTYITIKSGTVGFYRGKEIGREKKINNKENDNRKVVDS